MTMQDEQLQPADTGTALKRRVRGLSPLNLQGLLRREVFEYGPEPSNPPQAGKKQSRHAYRVTMWACPDCDDRYESEEDAEECCASPDEAPLDDHQRYTQLCPICGATADGAADAADCCLWKDLDQDTRYAIARRVEDGSTWARELGVWPPNSS
jgi:hypothetical protein